jgi:integrase
VAQIRVKIDQTIIEKAFEAARSGAAGRDIYADTEQRSLTLIRRGRDLGWYVKTRDFTRRLGDVAKSYKSKDALPPRAAREAAARLLTELRTSPKEREEAASTRVWTWADCVTARLLLLSGNRVVARRIKIPSAETLSDVRSAFGIDRKTGTFSAAKRPSLTVLQDIPLTALNAHVLGSAIRAINGVRPREKFLAYAKSMLTWAYSNSHESGFVVPAPWWPQIEPPQPSSEEISMMQANAEKLRSRKTGFRVQHVGDLLARHEDFCAGKVAEEKISPGIRWGIWWIALTANRRGSTTLLERTNVQQSDALGEDGWGTALWTEGQMKARKDFMLPVPPIGLHVINSSIADWQALINISHGFGHKTKWVFASTRREQRDGVGYDRPTDIAIHPSSLADHLRNMKGLKESAHPNVLAGLPDFSLHTIRSAATHFLENYPGLSAAASSAFLGHAPPLDDKDPEARSRTTERFYSVTQRMPLKTLAMKAWSGAVLDAYLKAGGVWPPRPYDIPIKKIYRTKRSIGS